MIGSPPPVGSKNEVPKLRSVSSMVMAPARTGRDNSSMKAVTRMAQANSGIRCSVMPGARMLKMVVIKLIEPRIDDAPAIWSARITRSIAGPGEPVCVDIGGYMVQPPAKPCSPPGPEGVKIEVTSNTAAATSSQNEILFRRGKAISGEPIIIGTNQLAKPPIVAGMTMKKIMMTAWAVTTELKACLA